MTGKIKLVCPTCQTINQFPQSRLADNPNCAKCKAEIIVGHPIEVNAQQLARHIQHSGIPILVDFWAPWCGPCQQFAPIYAQFAEKNKYSIRALKVNTELNQRAGATYNIRSIPTLAIFINGQEINRMSGALPLPQLIQWVSDSV
jgi:thioredoxin 2